MQLTLLRCNIASSKPKIPFINDAYRYSGKLVLDTTQSLFLLIKTVAGLIEWYALWYGQVDSHGMHSKPDHYCYHSFGNLAGNTDYEYEGMSDRVYRIHLLRENSSSA